MGRTVGGTVGGTVEGTMGVVVRGVRGGGRRNMSMGRRTVMGVVLTMRSIRGSIALCGVILVLLLVLLLLLVLVVRAVYSQRPVLVGGERQGGGQGEGTGRGEGGKATGSGGLITPIIEGRRIIQRIPQRCPLLLSLTITI